MSLRRILSRTISAQFRAASSSAFEFASPRFLPGLILRRCCLAFSVEIFGISFFLEVLLFLALLFVSPFFSVVSKVFSFFSVCVMICAVLFCCFFRCFVCFFSRFDFVSVRFLLSGNFNIFLGGTSAPRARDRDGGDRRAGKTAKSR